MPYKGSRPDIGAFEYVGKILTQCFGAGSTIDSDDVLVWAANYLQSNSISDTNNDNQINTFEFAYLMVDWGQNCSH